MFITDLIYSKRVVDGNSSPNLNEKKNSGVIMFKPGPVSFYSLRKYCLVILMLLSVLKCPFSMCKQPE